jgi:hypothetical protein
MDNLFDRRHRRHALDHFGNVVGNVGRHVQRVCERVMRACIVDVCTFVRTSKYSLNFELSRCARSLTGYNELMHRQCMFVGRQVSHPSVHGESILTID